MHEFRQKVLLSCELSAYIGRLSLLVGAREQLAEYVVGCEAPDKAGLDAEKPSFTVAVQTVTRPPNQAPR